MEHITVWAAHGDGGERGTGPVLAYYSTQYQAENAAKGRGWYGSNGRVSKHHALRFGSEVWLLQRPDPIDLDAVLAKRDAELREETLASLTDEQIRVLGIKR